MKILVFLHGTVIMPKSGIGKSREEIVKQSLNHEPAVLDYANYVSIGNAVLKLKKWRSQGAELLYLSSHENKEDIEKDKSVLKRFNFPEGQIYFRQNGESYADIAERLMSDILIEDDCESIGGEKEMTYTNIKPELKFKIKQIVVKEFEGIDHLPENIAELINYEQ